MTEPTKLTARKLNRRLPYYDFTSAAFKPYALAIGQATLSWNYLHEVLADAFVHFGGGSHAIWFSSALDRPRREMLRAAVNDVSLGESDVQKSIRAEMLWILGQAESLEDVRNNAVHSPLVFMSEELADIFGRERSGVSPLIFRGNPRALKLAQKDLLTEFRWLRDMARVLAEHSTAVMRTWAHAAPSLPRRPALPNRGLKSARPGRPRQRPVK
jgi:hypothetical protein